MTPMAVTETAEMAPMAPPMAPQPQSQSHGYPMPFLHQGYHMTNMSNMSHSSRSLHASPARPLSPHHRFESIEEVSVRPGASSPLMMMETDTSKYDTAKYRIPPAYAAIYPEKV